MQDSKAAYAKLTVAFYNNLAIKHYYTSRTR